MVEFGHFWRYPMQNGMQLVKQIDALTYNARSVLNALVRSTVTSGSYNGYTVTRAGQEIVLSRADIYRLYTFYQDWECVYSFSSDEAEFNALIKSVDKRLTPTESAGSVADALIKHSKILYMTPDNAANADVGSYWLGLVRESNNPKQVANSCPIPINLRSPIYDENLSTKKFSQFETYLFPTGYNSLDLLGYSGDNVDHVGGGRSWTYAVDGTFSVTASNMLLGYHDLSDKASKDYPFASVGSAPYYNVMTGYQCYAYGPNGFSGGNRSASIGESSFVYGDRNLAIGKGSLAIGGNSNFAVVGYSAAVGGQANTASSLGSFVTGYYSTSGGYRYHFRRFIAASNGVAESGTKCAETYIDKATGCTYKLSKTASLSSSNGDNSLTADQIVIDAPSVDFRVGDKVILYAFETVNDETNAAEYYNRGNHITRPKVVTVTSLEKLSYDIKVTFNEAITTVDDIVITGGFLSLYQTNRMGLAQYEDKLVMNSRYAGYASAALGYQVNAIGPYQTVVGEFNSPMTDPRFIVGCGDGYGLWNVVDARTNSFVSGPRYSFMKLNSSRVVMGVSDHVNSDKLADHGEVLSDEATELGVYQLSGAYAIAWDANYATKGINQIDSERGEMTVRSDGLVVHPQTKASGATSYSSTTDMSGKMISSRLGGTQGSTVIWSGNDPVADQEMWERFAQASDAFTVPLNKVAIYGEDGITVETPDILNLTARWTGDRTNHAGSSYIKADFERLVLTGETWNALPTTCDVKSFGLAQIPGIVPGYAAHHRLINSGFNFGWKSTGIYHNGLPNAFSSAYVACDGYHSLVSAYIYSTSDSHFTSSHTATSSPRAVDVSGLILPGAINKDIHTSETPHIMFFSNTLFGNGNSGVEPSGPTMYETIAFMSDLDKLNADVAQYRSGMANGTGFYCRVDGSTGKIYGKTGIQGNQGYKYFNHSLRTGGYSGGNFGIVGDYGSSQQTYSPLNWASTGDGTTKIGWSRAYSFYIWINGDKDGSNSSISSSIPIIHNLSYSLVGTQLTITFRFFLTAARYIEVLNNGGSGGATGQVGIGEHGYRFVLYPSIPGVGGLEYPQGETSGSCICHWIQGRANYGMKANMAPAAFIRTDGAMVIDICWNEPTALSYGFSDHKWNGALGDAFVPITIQGNVPLYSANTSMAYYGPHDDAANTYWDGRTGFTDTEVKTGFFTSIS